MAVPKGKVSSARRDKRRANWKMEVPNLSTCTKCGEPVLAHRACKNCGTYKNKAVMEPR